MKTDVIVIGAGPCGAAASIYLKRAGLDLLVFDSGDSALLKADKIENYFGFESVSGRELFEKGMCQLKRLGVQVIPEQVFSVSFDGGFTVKTKDGEYSCMSLLIACGSKRVKPPVPGFEDYLGRGASYCAVCDGFFFRGKDVAVIGAGEYALSEAKELARVCKSVVILTDGATDFTDFSDFEVRSDKIIAVEGNDRVTEVVLENGTLPVSGVFAAVGIAGAADFARHMGAALCGADIAVNENFETNIPGLYAAGDCVRGIKQISTAVGAGAAAAMQIIKYVRRK